MRKKVKRYKVDFDELERMRVYTINSIVKNLNEDSCSLSSCEIRKCLLDAVEY